MVRPLLRISLLFATALCTAGNARAETTPPAEASPSRKAAVLPGQQSLTASSYAPVFAPRAPVADTPAGETKESRWYGWQTLAVDAVAMTAFAYGIERGAGDVFSSDRGGEAFAYGGFGAYLLGGPAMHLIHDRPGSALGSFGLRMAAPLVGMYAGSAMAGCGHSSTNRDGEPCGLTESGIGIVVGAGTAIAIDAIFLARKETPGAEQRRQRAALRPQLAPGVVVTGERRALVLTGIF